MRVRFLHEAPNIKLALTVMVRAFIIYIKKRKLIMSFSISGYFEFFVFMFFLTTFVCFVREFWDYVFMKIVTGAK